MQAASGFSGRGRGEGFFFSKKNPSPQSPSSLSLFGLLRGQREIGPPSGPISPTIEPQKQLRGLHAGRKRFFWEGRGEGFFFSKKKPSPQSPSLLSL